MSRILPSPCRTLVTVLAVALLALIGTGCGSQATTAPATPGAASPAQSAVTTVAPPEFLAAAERQGTVVVDVRTPQEYATGHLQGAVNIDVEDPSFAARIAELDPAGTYAVYCRSGNRSSVASQQMAAAGFASVVNLAGGLTDLQRAGAEVVR